MLNLGIIWRLDELMFIVLMLNLLYGFAIYRHALTSHAFFIQQALLEEKSSRLAEQFRQAKRTRSRHCWIKSVSDHRQPRSAPACACYGLSD
ncbi:hypothetical protein ACVXG7_06455 [Enterobacter hormaechei]